jgi:hypothetical protein
MLGLVLDGHNPCFVVEGETGATTHIEGYMNPASGGPAVTCVHFVYDGSQGTVANRLKIYVNGVLRTIGGTPAWPAQVQYASGLPLKIGDCGNWTSLGFQMFDGAIGCVRLWKNVALTQAQVTTLTADLSTPVTYSRLGTTLQTGIVLNVEKDNRVCSATGKVFTDTNSPTTCTLATKINDLSGNEQHLVSNYGTALYEDTIGNGRGLRSYFYQFATAETYKPFASTGTVINYIKWNEAPTNYSENFTLGFDNFNGNSTGKYAMLGYVNTAGTCTEQLRIRNNSSPNGSVVSTATVAANTAYCNVWQGRSTGGASSYRHLRNGTEYTTALTGTTQQNAWLDVVTPIDHVYSAGFGVSNSPTSAAAGSSFNTIGPQCIINGDLTTTELSSVISELDYPYNIYSLAP